MYAEKKGDGSTSRPREMTMPTGSDAGDGLGLETRSFMGLVLVRLRADRVLCRGADDENGSPTTPCWRTGRSGIAGPHEGTSGARVSCERISLQHNHFTLPEILRRRARVAL